jgi:hypothetical protein
VERAFENVATFLALHLGESQGEVRLAPGAANRASRAQALEMTSSHRL